MALQESSLDRTVFKWRSAAKRSQNFIFEDHIPRSIDFRDVIEALKHVVKKQQTPRFGAIILIYD